MDKRSKNNQKTHLHDIRKNIFKYKPAVQFDRKDQTILTRIRIGHTSITHKHLLTIEPKPVCDHCGNSLTIQHLLTQCRKFKEERKNTTWIIKRLDIY